MLSEKQAHTITSSGKRPQSSFGNPRRTRSGRWIGSRHRWTVRFRPCSFEGGVIAARDKWIETFQEAYTKGHEAEDQIREIQKQHGANPANDTDEGRLLDLNRRRLEACTMQSDIAKDELKRAWNDLRDDLQKKMLDGLLVARGFREPHVAGGTEVEIPSSEWRILVLDNVNSEALRKGSGAVIYSGVAFGKRT